MTKLSILVCGLVLGACTGSITGSPSDVGGNRLLVAYLLQERHVSVNELLAKKRDRAAVENELRGAP